MIRIKELTVNFELTVQPKQYNAMKAGGSVTIQYDELVNALVGDLPGFYADLKQDLIASVKETIREQTEAIYGKAAAEYVLKQAG